MNDLSIHNARQKLQDIWGYDSFRSGQEEVIESVLNGVDTLVLFPTGGGKSLCYQIPAVLFGGVTVVISPLIALMQDQVQQLNERGISATFINSMLSSWEVEQRLVNARNGMYDLLYCAPERLKSTRWEAELPHLNIDLIAIDEAHCISEWGHDFRPDYRQIRPAFESVADSIRWIALTATATPEVRDDIIKNLQFENPAIVSTGFQRPNLKWWVFESPKKDRNLLRSVKKAAPKGSGIVYGGTRKNCERLAELIRQEIGISSAAYHAGVDSKNRRHIQEQWLTGDLPLVIATTAFGMGIDKADCRYVIHYEMPYSLEAYYQQAGRAGRDGRESYPLLLFKAADAHRAKKRINDSYPTKDELQKVYDAICDTLNLALGSMETEMREISVSSLKKRANFSSKTVSAALKTLKHLGIVEMRDYIYPQIGIHFIVNPDYLQQKIKEEENRRKAEFLDRLLRQCSGEAFAEMKYITLDYLLQKLDVGKNELIKGLQVLQNHDQILKFEALGELPLIRPVEARMRTLPLDKKRLERHRNSLLKKLDYMTGYIATEGCREVYIRTYFGEENVHPCGHCDNCLRRANEKNEAALMENLKSIKKLLDGKQLNLDEIKRQSSLSRNQIERALAYLQRENKVILKGENYRWVG